MASPALNNPYQQQYQQFASNPEQFWREQADLIQWYRKPQTILSKDHNDYYRWYSDGELNTSYLCLDYHIEQGRGEQAALIYDSPVTDTQKTLTYNQLRDQVALFAGGLKNLGVNKGDRVVIYMPMVAEAAVAMLACARLGAVHSVVFGGFAPHELAVRIDDAKPKVVVTASCGIEVSKVIAYKPLVDEAIASASHKPEHCVLLQRSQCQADMQAPRDIDWQQLMADAQPAEPVPVLGTDPLYILYTSGTTGKPKGVVRDNGGHAVAMRYSMETVYDVKAG
ncbi:MAG: AMP-binding protein, partial [Porticoccaceae bacterium]|nr:AMP-binding protein [Porticoccaceae bacterium]